MTTLFISAFLLGLIFNAPPRCRVRRNGAPGRARRLPTCVGSAAGLAGRRCAVGGARAGRHGLLLQLDWLRWPIGVAGTLYLLWLARDAWRAASVEFLVAGDAGVTQRSATRAGVLLSVTNPQNIAYWAALGSAMGAVGVHEPSATDYGIFFAGFMVSSVVWAFVCAAIVDRLFARAGQQWAKRPIACARWPLWRSRWAPCGI